MSNNNNLIRLSNFIQLITFFLVGILVYFSPLKNLEAKVNPPKNIQCDETTVYPDDFLSIYEKYNLLYTEKKIYRRSVRSCRNLKSDLNHYRRRVHLNFFVSTPFNFPPLISVGLSNNYRNRFVYGMRLGGTLGNAWTDTQTAFYDLTPYFHFRFTPYEKGRGHYLGLKASLREYKITHQIVSGHTDSRAFSGTIDGYLQTINTGLYYGFEHTYNTSLEFGAEVNLYAKRRKSFDYSSLTQEQKDSVYNQETIANGLDEMEENFNGQIRVSYLYLAFVYHI